MKRTIFALVIQLFAISAFAECATPPWGDSAQVRPWTEAVIQVVQARIGDFEKAVDKEEFCPGYDSATDEEKQNCWLFLVAGVTKYESNFVEAPRPFREPNGTLSAGLLALSPGECPNAKTLAELNVGEKNLICGTNMMASLIAQGRAISRNGHGAAAYWSTLRARQSFYDRSRGITLKLGYKSEILEITKKYR